MGTAAWESDGCDPTCTVPIPTTTRDVPPFHFSVKADLLSIIRCGLVEATTCIKVQNRGTGKTSGTKGLEAGGEGVNSPRCREPILFRDAQNLTLAAVPAVMKKAVETAV
jgi:hypothetical protein